MFQTNRFHRWVSQLNGVFYLFNPIFMKIIGRHIYIQTKLDEIARLEARLFERIIQEQMCDDPARKKEISKSVDTLQRIYASVYAHEKHIINNSKD